MTTREVLRRKKLTYFTVAVASLLLSALALQGALFTNATWLVYPAAFLGLITVGGVLAYRFAVRCPRCRGNIGFSHSNFGRHRVFGRPLMNCPFCGVPLDGSQAP